MPDIEISSAPTIESLSEHEEEEDWFKPLYKFKKSTKARVAAMMAFCEADLSNHDPLEALSRLDIYKSLSSYGAQRATKVVKYVKEKQRYLDSCIEQHIHKGTSHEIPLIDRNIIRIAFAEANLTPATTYVPLIRESTAIAEAFGSDRSSAFVNALLGALLEGKRSKAPHNLTKT